MHIFNLDLLRLCLDCSDSAQTQLGQVRECKLPKNMPKYQKISSHILGHTQTPYRLHIVPNRCDITYAMFAKVSKDIFYILDYTQTPYRLHTVPNMCDITYVHQSMPKYQRNAFTDPRSHTDSIWTPHSPKHV